MIPQRLERVGCSTEFPHRGRRWPRPAHYSELVIRSPWLAAFDASTRIRLGFALVSALIAVATGSALAVLPWLLIVVAVDLVVVALSRMPISRGGVFDTIVLTLLAVEAATAGVGFAIASVGAALLILIPTYHAGTRFGRLGYLLTGLAGFVSALLVTLVVGGVEEIQPSYLAWLLAALVLGGLGVWNQRLVAERAEAEADPAAREAVELIQRLRSLSGQLSTGLDAPASASRALDLLAGSVPSMRSAVLVSEDGEHLVPLALRGSTRAPWHIADDVSSILQRRRSRWEPTTIDLGENHSRRQALVTPFTLVDGPATVIVVERDGKHPFTETEKRAALDLTRRLAPTVQAGLLFGTLRQYASLEERNRIARDIHDGIAQELAALGYAVDALRMKAASVGATGLRDGLDTLRVQLGDAMADLRFHISDLRVAERPGSGLGAVIGGTVQSFGNMTGMRTTVTVSETRQRLDPQVEIVFHRLVMDVLADAQAAGAKGAWVTLTTRSSGPATLEIAHDGSYERAERLFRQPQLGDLHGTVALTRDTQRRATVTLTVEQPERLTAHDAN
jgi:signal transduction histidine kinase